MKPMRKALALLLAALLTVGCAQTVFAFNAVRSAQNLTVDGEAVKCDKYNIDGSNYFKLRDLAELLDGTECQFDVGWDDVNKVVSITTDHAYTTRNGHELEIGADLSASTVVSSQTIMIDGAVRTDLTVYNIGGSNFFKLRELGDALGFFVDYDPASNTAVVASTEPEPEPDNAVYERGSDAAIYDAALGDFAALMAQADAATDTDERFVRYAKAEAALLDSGVMIPTTTQGGGYAMNRVAPHTVPFARVGSDDARLAGLVLSGDSFLTPAERAVFLEAWDAARTGGADYDPAGILRRLGHSVGSEYSTSFSTAPVTLDWLATSSEADTEILVNLVDGLVQYDNLGRLQPALAQSWDVSDDGLTYTFHIRPGVNWYNADGTVYAPLTAGDFVAGFRHMLDAQAGLEWLVEGVVDGVYDYLYGSGDFSAVGCRAVDSSTLVLTLEKPLPYFLSMLTYSCFLPICDSFYTAQGGRFGSDYLSDTYSFGAFPETGTQVYCGAFLPEWIETAVNDEGLFEVLEIRLKKNPGYYNADRVTVGTLRWRSSADMSPADFYNAAVSGGFAGVGLNASGGTLELAQDDGNFAAYAYVTDTTSTTFFGALNLNRGTFALPNGAADSGKTERQKLDTAAAMQNKAFRQALQFAFDKAACNAASSGEALKYNSLRNMYTAPDFVVLSSDTTVDGETFPAGTLYGELVQHFLEALGSPVKTADGIDGWYNPAAARARLAEAKQALGGSVAWPVVIDVVYFAPSDANAAQAEAYKRSVEDTLGAENVTVHLIATDSSADYYDCGYRAANGAAGNFDMFYGSGWGPDFADPSTYLDTFLGGGEGHMTITLGLF